MKARTLEELEIWQRAMSMSDVISEILDRPAVKSDRGLWEQLGDSSVSVVSNIAEGFGQANRTFARYLRISRGSNNEARTQLRVALKRRHISQNEFAALTQASTTLGKMITAFIRYLDEDDRGSRTKN